MRHFLIYMSILGLLFFSDCTSRKNIMYLHSSSDTEENISYSKNPIENNLQIGDVVYVRILSINEEINDLFNLNNTGSTNVSSETSITLKGFTINPDGFIKLPVIDTIHVEGLTIFEAEAVIQKKVNDFFKDATVIVKLLNAKVSVLGEVNRPGNFIVYRNELTIFEAIALAGDINQYGDKRKVMIIRTSGNKNETYRIDLTNADIMSKEKLYVKPGDVIIVEPLKLKSFRLNTPTISLLLSSISTLILTLEYLNK
ncbi:MAG: polysaccharide biosynthesis/export family protein [Bacteroidales bacterium]